MLLNKLLGRNLSRSPVVLIALVLSLGSVQAQVVRIEGTSVQPVLAGQKFGTVGAYEIVQAKMHFEIDPKAPGNGRIVDLPLAITGGGNKVAYTADLYVLKPQDPGRGNGVMLFDVANRGNKVVLGMLNRCARTNSPESAADFGDGYLMQQGYTVVWIGWQYDVVLGGGRMALQAPIAQGVDGPIEGFVRYWFRAANKSDKASLQGAARGGVQFALVDPDNELHQLTVRDSYSDTREVIDRADWLFVDDSTAIQLNGGFEPGRLYELVYKSQNPAVSGLGYSAIRDGVSYLVSKPELVGNIDHTLAFGASQSGRFLRGFLYEGFNAFYDKPGKRGAAEEPTATRVFDGIMPHIAAASRTGFNRRFARPSTVEPSRFPYSDAVQIDDELEDGLLVAARQANVVPKLMLTNSSNEYWREFKAAALVHVDVTGQKDIELDKNTRLYTFAGTQHGSGQFPPIRSEIPSQHLDNPTDYTWLNRALLESMRLWVTEGVEPPPSRYPKLADGTLVAKDHMIFPKIPNVIPPVQVMGMFRLNYGPDYRNTRVASIVPPEIGVPYPILVPQNDADGNELAGIRLPEIEIPLATYTGWNFRHPSIGAPNQLSVLNGSYLPFAETKAERLASGDQRLSISERYLSRAHYLGLVTETALKLVDDRLLLPQDLAPVLERAADHWDYAKAIVGEAEGVEEVEEPAPANLLGTP